MRYTKMLAAVLVGLLGVPVAAQSQIAAGKVLVTTTNMALYTFPGQTAFAVGDLHVILVAVSDSMSNGVILEAGGYAHYTRVATAPKQNGSGIMHVFVRDYLATDTIPRSIEYWVVDDLGTGAEMFSVIVKGMTKAGAAAIRQVAVTSGPARTSADLVFDLPLLPTNEVLSFVSNNTNPSGMTAPFGFTAVTDVGYQKPVSGAAWAYISSGVGTAVSWGESRSNFGAMALELNR